jgi:hypothetical protein
MKDMTTKIQEWISSNIPAEHFTYKKNWSRNNCFIRDRLIETLFNSKEAEVIGTHVSKSILCPVVKTYYKDVEIIWQYNFYGWQIMINSPVELKLFNLKLYSATGNYLYYQGIPEEYQYKQYSKSDRQKFAINITGDDLLDVWAFALELRKAIK